MLMQKGTVLKWIVHRECHLSGTVCVVFSESEDCVNESNTAVCFFLSIGNQRAIM